MRWRRSRWPTRRSGGLPGSVPTLRPSSSGSSSRPFAARPHPSASPGRWLACSRRTPTSTRAGGCCSATSSRISPTTCSSAATRSSWARQSRVECRSSTTASSSSPRACRPRGDQGFAGARRSCATPSATSCPASSWTGRREGLRCRSHGSCSPTPTDARAAPPLGARRRAGLLREGGDRRAAAGRSPRPSGAGAPDLHARLARALASRKRRRLADPPADRDGGASRRGGRAGPAAPTARRARSLGARDVRASTSFVVLSTQRSGSTWVVDMLDSHPRVSCYGELLLPEGTGKHPVGAQDTVPLSDVLRERRSGSLARHLEGWRYLDRLYGGKPSPSGSSSCTPRCARFPGCSPTWL